MTNKTPLPPGSTIGILGGGQLGRMLSLAAADLGFKVHVFAPPGDNPAIATAAEATIADWDDTGAVDSFARAVDVATYEFENIPEATVRRVGQSVPVRPGVNSLAIAQDRLAEKTMATSLGLAVAPYAQVDTSTDLEAGIVKIGLPAILKTRRFGYDGKGQAAVGQTQDADAAWRLVGSAPSILEKRVDFQSEISVIITRTADGNTRAFDIPQNVHRAGILATSTLPASISVETAEQALATAEQLAVALDHVGVLSVEMFVVDDQTGSILVNEIAPRVHNSGHWTTDAANVSQFEQHIRAICGWACLQPTRHADVVMTNLIGADIENWEQLAAEPDTRLHIYGKHDLRPGRKMGHVNRLRCRRQSVNYHRPAL